MRHIKILTLSFFFLFKEVTFAAMQFPGKDAQKTIYENGTFCLEKGEFFWREGYHCCSGLVGHLRPDYIGQASCQPYTTAIIENIVYAPVMWLFFAIGVIFLIIFLIRKRKKS